MKRTHYSKISMSVDTAIKMLSKMRDEIDEYNDYGKAEDMGIQALIALDKKSPISEDGTLTVTVDDATKIGRVLVQDSKHNGGLFYADIDRNR